MDKILSKIPLEYRPFLVPAVGLLLVIIVSVTFGPYVYGKINQEMSTIADLKVKQSKLETKKELLENQDEKLLVQRSQAAVNAVPGDSPSLAALSSTGRQAQENGISLTDFRVTERKDKNTSLLEFTLNIEGGLAGTLTFLNNMKNSAPLLKISEIRATVQGGVARARVLLGSVWGPLPQKIGGAEDSLEALTKPEEEIADKFIKLKQPQGATAKTSSPQGRSNPFVQ